MECRGWHGEAPRGLGVGVVFGMVRVIFRAVGVFGGRGVFRGSGLPGLAGPEEGVEDDQEFSHTGHQGHLGRFARLAEALVELSDERVAPGGCEGGHVEDGSDPDPAAPDGPMAVEASAIPVQRGHAHQGRDLASVELSEFRQVGQQTGGRLLAHARHAAEQLLFGLPDGRLADQMADFGLDASNVALEVLEHPLDALADRQRRVLEESEFFLGLRFDELVSSGSKFFQEKELFVGQGPNGRPDGFAEPGQDKGVDAVGFGQPPGGPGEVACLFGVDDHPGQVGQGQAGHQALFVAAGGLQDDPLAGPLLAEFQKALDTFRRVGQGLAMRLVFLWVQPDEFQGIFRDVDSQIPTGNREGGSRHERFLLEVERETVPISCGIPQEKPSEAISGLTLPDAGLSAKTALHTVQTLDMAGRPAHRDPFSPTGLEPKGATISRGPECVGCGS